MKRTHIKNNDNERTQQMQNDAKTIVPPLKIQGIKTKIIPHILDLLKEQKFETWYEPFLGSGSVLFNVAPKKAIVSDLNPLIINFYKDIQQGKIDSQLVREYLEEEGNKLLLTNGEHYYTIRERMNKKQSSLDFLFVNRSCFNGVMRFNRKGGFNVPFCRKPHRFEKALVTKICNQVKRVEHIIKSSDWEFLLQDWRETIKTSSENDLIYCDPPYIGRHTDYYTKFLDNDSYELAEVLMKNKAQFILSTWIKNKYRSNEFVELFEENYSIVKIEHFYHVGATEKLRNSVLEGLIHNMKE